MALFAMGGCGADDAADPMGEVGEIAPFVRMGDQDPYRLIGLAVDSATYAELVAPLGGTPIDIVDLGPSASGKREVTLHLDAKAPPEVYELLLGSWQDGTALRPYHATNFAILLGGSGGGRDDDSTENPSGELGIGLGTGTTLALLLPAVQKIQEAAVHEDATFELAIEAEGTIMEVPLPEDTTAGGVRVSVGDVKGFIGQDTNPPLSLSVIGGVDFGDADGGPQTQPIELARPANGLPAWFDFDQPVTLAVDVRDGSGAVLRRFRIPEAQPEPDIGLSITLGPAKAIYMEYEGIKGNATDDTAETALVETHYTTYVDRFYGPAVAVLQGFTELSADGDPPSLADLRGYWTAESRPVMIESLQHAVAHAAEMEGLLCQVALPTMIEMAQTLDTAGMTDAGSAIVTVAEARTTIPAPIQGAFAGGSLELDALAAVPATAADVKVACLALAATSPYADVIAGAGPGAGPRFAAVKTAGAIAASPRVLDRGLAKWVALLDALLAGEITDTDTALADAKTAAESLAASLSELSAASEQRYDLAHEILGL